MVRKVNPMMDFCPSPELMAPIAWCQEREVIFGALWNLQGLVRVI